MLVKPMSLPARKQEHQEGWYKTHAAQAVPFGGEALQDAGHLLAHDLKLGHLRVRLHLLHHLQAGLTHMSVPQKLRVRDKSKQSPTI